MSQTSCLVCGWSRPVGGGAPVDASDPFRDVLATSDSTDDPFGERKASGALPSNMPAIPTLPKGPQGAVAAQSGFLSTSPMLFVAAAAFGFLGVLLVGGLLMLALSGDDPVDVAGAQEAVRVLSRKPDRSALDYITLGHAHADLDDVGKALAAYRSAASKGSVDERSVQYAFAHLKDPLQGRYAGLLLAEVHRDDVTERLIEGVENDNLNHRRNSLLALETRHAATDALREKVARLDLISDATCDMRKEALLVLEKIGASAEAAIAIETAIGRGAVENSCMSTNLPIVLRMVRERAGS